MLPVFDIFLILILSAFQRCLDILFSVNSLNQLNSSCFRREVPKTQAQVFGKPSFFMTFRIFPPICLLPIHRKTEG